MSDDRRMTRLIALVQRVTTWLAAFVLVCLVAGTAYLFLGPAEVNVEAPKDRPCTSCEDAPRDAPSDAPDHGNHGGYGGGSLN